MKRVDEHRERADDAADIDEAAANWLARRVGGLGADEQVTFSRWLAADARHAATFAELERTWRSLDALNEIRLPDGRQLDHDLPFVHARIESGQAGHEPGGRRRRHVAKVISLATAMAAVAAVMVLFVRPREELAQPMVRSAFTETGGFKMLSLPDGSVIRLNTDSAIEVEFSRKERRVKLTRGEGNFSVAKDPARPFIVRAGHVDVRAVGTAFNVRFESAAVDVLVTEGKVRVEHAFKGESFLAGTILPGGNAPATESAGVPVLEAGQRVTIPRSEPTVAAKAVVVAVAAEDAARELAWQDRRLEFADAPLREVVAEFNRYNRHNLVIADPRLNERRFGGSIRADNGEAFVRLLESRFGVKAEQRETETLLRVAP